MPTAPGRGRWLVLAWVAVFLAVTFVISRRDERGFDAAERVRVHTDSLQVLLDIHARILAELAGQRSPREVAERGVALGLRLPSDSEIVTLRIPAP